MRLPQGPLRSLNFRLLLACNVISATGSAGATVALPFAVLAIGGSASDVGYVAAAYLVSFIVFLLLGGVIADRLPRHQVMVAANALQALAQAGSAFLVLTGDAHVWELMALAAARGIGSGFFFPASEGLLPQTVPADQRAQANAMDRIGRNGGQIGGAALGGVLVGLAGPGWGLAVDATSFAIAGALRAGMHFPALPPVPTTGMLHDMREGWRDFISRRWLWTIVLEFGFIVAILTATTSVLGPIVAHSHLGGARNWGLILAAYAIGAVLGGFVMLKLRPRRMLLAASLSVPADSVFLFALAVPLAVPLIAAAALLAGGCLQVFSVNWATTMQQEIPSAMLSRLSSYDALGSLALAPAGTAVAGPLASVFGTPAVLTAGGILIVLLTVAVLFVPEVRHMQRQIPARPDQTDMPTS
jgi:predicted MFS family arabinose efflux permease